MASESDHSRAPRAMSIGQVLSLTSRVIMNYPGVVLGIAFLFGTLPQTVIAILQQLFGQPSFTLSYADLAIAAAVQMLGLAARLILGVVVQGALVRATMTVNEGERPDFGACVGTAFARLLPLLGVAVLGTLGIVFGLMLLIVPGVLLYLIWSVAGPVAVVERRGVIDSLRRSAALTKGARANVFALVLLTWVILLIAGAISGSVMDAIDQAPGLGAASLGGFPLTAIIVSAVINTVVTVVIATIPTALYIELRDSKGDAATGSLEDVFA